MLLVFGVTGHSSTLSSVIRWADGRLRDELFEVETLQTKNITLLTLNWKDSSTHQRNGALQAYIDGGAV